MPAVKKIVDTTEVTQLRLSGNDILAYVKDLIPENAREVKVYFTVPGGGDWSGMNVEIDNKDAVIVKYTVTVRSVE